MIVVIIVLGGLGLLVVCGGIGTALFLPAVQQARQAARRSASKNISSRLVSPRTTFTTHTSTFLRTASSRRNKQGGTVGKLGFFR